MTHSRVTPEGQLVGIVSTRLAQKGHARLKAQGLDKVQAPSLRDSMCKTCACQPGSVPNGCLQTQLDFLKAAAEGRPFLCHSPHDGKLCTGWVHARAEISANPLPRQVQELIDNWEYSPPDEDNSKAP